MFTLYCEETNQPELAKKTGQIGLIFDWKKGKFVDAHAGIGMFRLDYCENTPKNWLSLEFYKITKSLHENIGFGQLYLHWHRLNRFKQPQCGVLWLSELHDVGSKTRPDWLNFSNLEDFIDNYEPIKHPWDK